MLVVGPDAVVDEDAVVVVFGYAALADGAVLASGWFEEVAGVAFVAWVEEGEVVGVAGHLLGVVGGGDVPWVGEGGEVEEEVREDDGDGAGEFDEGGELRPGGGEVEDFAYGEEEEEEYQDGWMSVVHHVIPEADTSWGDSAAGDTAVDGFEDVREVDPYYFVKP